MSEKEDFKLEISQEKEVRILTGKQIVIFNLPNIGFQAMFGLFQSFLLIFYINIMGQPPIVLGVLFSLAVYVYAIMNPIWGSISDNISTRFGRKKTVMLIMGPIMAISYILIWLPPIPDTPYGVLNIPLILNFTLFLYIFRVSIAGYQSTYYSLLPEISTEETNRIRISMVGMIMTVLGVAIAMLFPIFIMGDITEDLPPENPDFFYPNSPIGQQIYQNAFLIGLMVTIIFILSYVLIIFGIKEPEKSVQEKRKVGQLLKDLASPFKDKNYTLLLVALFLIWIPMMNLQFSLINYATLGLSLRGSEFLVFGVVLLFSAIISFVIWDKVSKKIGLKKTMTITMSLACVSYFLNIILLIPMEHMFSATIGIILLSLSLSALVGTMIFPLAIVSSIVDQKESETGKSVSGAYMGSFNMVLSLGTGTATLLLSLFLQVLGESIGSSYIIIILFGSILVIPGVLLFQKVKIRSSLNAKSK